MSALIGRSPGIETLNVLTLDLLWISVQKL